MSNFVRNTILFFSANANAYSASIAPPAGTIYTITSNTFTATTDVPSPVYTWSVGAGDTIVSGQGTASVVVKFGAAGTRSVSLSVTGGGSASATWSGTVTAFTPSIFSGLSLWLDAADAATITVDGSSLVGQWDDKSGNGLNVIQGATLNKPTFSPGDGIVFGGAAHQLTNATSINITTNLTAFVAFRCTDTASYGTTAGNDTFATHGGWQIQTGSSGTWGRFQVTKTLVATRVFTGITQIKTTDRIYRVAANATNIRGRVIGSTTQDDTAVAMTTGSGATTNIGAFPRGNMVIREVLVYSAALTDTQIGQVESYLSAKWTT